MQSTFELIAEQLDRHTLAIMDGLLPEDVLQSLLAETKQLLDEFQPALIGRGITEQRISEIRGDNILWLEKDQLTKAQAFYFHFLEQLREYLSNYFRIGLPWFECHLATYPVGSFYTRLLTSSAKRTTEFLPLFCT